jgi:hypothetical protein
MSSRECALVMAAILKPFPNFLLLRFVYSSILQLESTNKNLFVIDKQIFLGFIFLFEYFQFKLVFQENLELDHEINETQNFEFVKLLSLSQLRDFQRDEFLNCISWYAKPVKSFNLLSCLQ